jgi:hypothetical protein
MRAQKVLASGTRICKEIPQVTSQIIRSATIAAFIAVRVAALTFAHSVQMTPYEIKTSRRTYSGIPVGGSPFTEGPSPITIDAVLVPLIIQIIKTNETVAPFDPMKPDSSCENSYSAEDRFRHSPLVVASDLTFNGVDVEKGQCADCFMREKFSNAPVSRGPNRASYISALEWSFASTFILAIVRPAGGPQRCERHPVSGSSCA